MGSVGIKRERRRRERRRRRRRRVMMNGRGRCESVKMQRCQV
jgi:hypothetical protein